MTNLSHKFSLTIVLGLFTISPAWSTIEISSKPANSWADWREEAIREAVCTSWANSGILNRAREGIHRRENNGDPEKLIRWTESLRHDYEQGRVDSVRQELEKFIDLEWGWSGLHDDQEIMIGLACGLDFIEEWNNE